MSQWISKRCGAFDEVQLYKVDLLKFLGNWGVTTVQVMIYLTCILSLTCSISASCQHKTIIESATIGWHKCRIFSIQLNANTNVFYSSLTTCLSCVSQKIQKNWNRVYFCHIDPNHQRVSKLGGFFCGRWLIKDAIVCTLAPLLLEGLSFQFRTLIVRKICVFSWQKITPWI